STRSFADEALTGAVSPLMYSIRADIWTRYGVNHNLALLGAHGAARDVNSTRMWKFHKAEAYYNGAVEQTLVEKFTPPAFRQSRLRYLAPPQHEAALAAPFSVFAYLRAQLQLFATNPGQSLSGWFKTWFDRIYDPVWVREADGL